MGKAENWTRVGTILFKNEKNIYYLNIYAICLYSKCTNKNHNA